MPRQQDQVLLIAVVAVVSVVFVTLFRFPTDYSDSSLLFEDEHKNDEVRGGGSRTPYEKCMRRLEPYPYDPREHVFLYNAKTRDANLTLRQAFEANHTTIYFLHQRKAGGSSIRAMLFQMANQTLGQERALKESFVPCLAQNCVNFELPLYEANYLQDVKLVGAHMSYHTPMARATYEDQVLITNFREPISRIKSCMVYRYLPQLKRVFGNRNYTHADGEHLLLHQKDEFSSTCVQEPLRILSPLNPDKAPLSLHNMHHICCMVSAHFHVILTPQPTNLSENNASMTRIEREITGWMQHNTVNKNINATLLSNVEKTNLASFLQHIQTHPMVQAESNLYNCILQRQKHML